MKWQDKAILLSLRRHGEGNFIVNFLTKEHGRYCGFLRVSKKKQFEYQVGSIFNVSWYARVPEHLGMWQAEMLYNPFALIFNKKLPLYSLVAACSLVCRMLPERNPEEEIFRLMDAFIYNIGNSSWFIKYINFEFGLLRNLGFEFNFSRCALTGESSNLKYLSPKSGKVVSESVGKAYEKKLLTVPKFLVNNYEKVSISEMLEGLSLTEFFFKRYVFASHEMRVPKEKTQFISALKRAEE